MESNYSMILCSTIAHYRKICGLTQEQLAQELGISAKAISKWENNLSYPDISLIPKISNIFNITIDELFGKKYERDVIYNFVANLNWEDDNKFRIALFNGRKLITHEVQDCKEGNNKFNFRFLGSPFDMYGYCEINCEKENRSKKYLDNSREEKSI